MIKIEKCEVVGFEHSIRGLRNPMNSWDNSDSGFRCKIDDGACNEHNCENYGKCNSVDKLNYRVGNNDLTLMQKLFKAGTDHRKFMRMITVYADITAPLYWWKEFDTYKVGTVANSCSTMHKIHDKKFTIDDFSHEHLDIECLETLIIIVNDLNEYRNKFLETKDKECWWQMIQLLPSSYNQKRTVMLNYEVLANIYKSRKTHKLDEWVDFCKWIDELPYFSEIVGVGIED